MLLCLCTGIIRLHQVQDTANFFLKIMPVLFIPAIVGLIDVGDTLVAILVPLLVVIIVTTYIVMAVTGKVTDGILRTERREEKVKEFFHNSVYFGVVLSLAGYFLGMFLHKKTKCGLCNPLLIASVFVISFLLLTKILTVITTPARNI